MVDKCTLQLINEQCLIFLVAQACDPSGGLKACASRFLEWGIKREAGFTEQRKPPAPGSGRITGLVHSEPPWLNELTPTGPSFFLPFLCYFV
ncbi:hypothetical protein ES332_D03G183600v1 [Gossypium tomentosum]|uniref:Uncharacterized protein n=1 Tax=Gossypium tomentosum TaxID=34277 RepID=A0A5D2LNZ2_GOSTO|nr:hypothetical protein ES332_D03G183600v1 [Gossypium tomentosum]